MYSQVINLRLSLYEQFKGRRVSILTSRGGKEIGTLLHVDEKYAEVTLLTEDNRLVSISKGGINSISIELNHGITKIPELGVQIQNNIIKDIPKEDTGELPTDSKGNHIKKALPLIPDDDSESNLDER